MKLSINPGPYNGGTNFGFTISTDNCKILSNVLWDWYDSLSEIATNAIDITTVNIDKRANGELIVIKVILFGEKDPQNQIEMSVFNYAHCKLIESKEKFKNILNEKLGWFLFFLTLDPNFYWYDTRMRVSLRETRIQISLLHSTYCVLLSIYRSFIKFNRE